MPDFGVSLKEATTLLSLFPNQGTAFATMPGRTLDSLHKNEQFHSYLLLRYWYPDKAMTVFSF